MTSSALFSRGLDTRMFSVQKDEVDFTSSSDSSSDEGSPSRRNSYKDEYNVPAVPFERTTTQSKEWRSPSTIFQRTFLERSWGQKILTAAMMDKGHHLVNDTHQGPVPSMPLWHDIAVLLPPSIATPVVQQVMFNYGVRWSPLATFAIYFVSLTMFFNFSAWRFNNLGKKYGVFNQAVRGRDMIPDSSVDIMAGGIVMYFAYRIGHMCYYYYDPAVAPLSNYGWDYVFRWQAWFLVMDYLFYAYHRSTHEFSFLWPIHAHHHQAKAPTMAHAILADHMQHITEIIIIPSLTTYLVPLSFHEQWILYLWLAHIETMGHSGVRIHAANPNTWLACLPFGAELTVEDHDLHHRYGKSGKNYGKQTRFWDMVFGTMEERVESKDCTTRWL